MKRCQSCGRGYEGLIKVNGVEVPASAVWCARCREQKATHFSAGGHAQSVMPQVRWARWIQPYGVGCAESTLRDCRIFLHTIMRSIPCRGTGFAGVDPDANGGWAAVVRAYEDYS